MALVLEPLRDDHLDDVVAVEHACVEPGQRGWSRQLFADELAQEGRCYLVALLDDELVGFGGVWLAPDEAHVTTLSVRQDARRQGIATALLSELLAHAAAGGVRAATLEVRASNTAALRLYAACGFVPVGVRPRYYPSGEDAVIMWLHHLASRSAASVGQPRPPSALSRASRGPASRGVQATQAGASRSAASAGSADGFAQTSGVEHLSTATGGGAC